jgi:hypothetical protein
MKTSLKRTGLLFGLMTCMSNPLALPAFADSTADLLLSLKCQNGYIVNVWKRHGSQELLYRGIGLLGNLNLGTGTNDNTGAARVFKFKNGNYVYQVLGGRSERHGRGTLEVFKNGRSMLSQTCTVQ